MSLKRLKAAVFAALVISLAPGLAVAGGVDALKHFLSTTRTFKADFVQTVQGKPGRKPQQSSGVMIFSRPGKFRWQIDKPYPQLMVSDGQKFWIYDPELKQVTVRKLGAALGSTPVALLSGKNELDKNFTLKDDGEIEGTQWVVAIPKQADSGFEKVRLGFVDGKLNTMELFDSFGQTTHLVFSGLDINPELSQGRFGFKPPVGVDVVEGMGL